MYGDGTGDGQAGSDGTGRAEVGVEGGVDVMEWARVVAKYTRSLKEPAVLSHCESEGNEMPTKRALNKLRKGVVKIRYIPF